MAREIKFRFWNHASKSFCFDRLIDSDGDIFKQSPAFDDYYCELNECDEVTACQYTGLTDKNGKEIYEGDVIKYESVYGDIGTKKVDFEEGMFCVSHLALAQLGSIEILGNIYENPELI